MHQLPAFRDAFQSGRCLITRQWVIRVAQAARRRQKLPCGYIAPTGKPVAFAGIIGDGSGDGQQAAAIITTEPNSLMASVHHRMPVILEPEDWRQWLHDDSRSSDLRALMLPAGMAGPGPCGNVSNALNRAGKRRAAPGCWPLDSAIVPAAVAK